MNTRRLRYLRDGAGLLVAAGLAWWAFTRADVQGIVTALRSGDAAWMSAALAVLAVCHVARVHRWSSLCARAGCSRAAAALAGPFGLLAVTLLPFRLGEGVRLALQRRFDSGSALTGLVGLTMIERAGDLFGILALIAGGFAFAGRPLFAIGLVAATAIAIASVSRLAGGRPALRASSLLLVAGNSLFAWAGDALAIACLARAVGAAVPFERAATAAGTVALGVALPTAPAGLGTHQAVMAWSLSGAASMEHAIAISLAMLAAIVVVQAGLSAIAALVVLVGGFARGAQER